MYAVTVWQNQMGKNVIGDECMRICANKLDVALARQCKNATDLNDAVSFTTLQRIRNGCEVTPKTAGKIAKALSVDISELVEITERTED